MGPYEGTFKAVKSKWDNVARTLSPGLLYGRYSFIGLPPTLPFLQQTALTATAGDSL